MDLFSTVFKLWKCVLQFSQEILKLQVQGWTMSGSIVGLGIRILAHMHSFICPFLFLSSLQAVNICVTVFSGTIQARNLKLGARMEGIMLCFIRLRMMLLIVICPFIRPVFFLSSFQTLNVRDIHFPQELFKL